MSPADDQLLRRAGRVVTGLAIGAVTAFVEFAYVVVTLPFLTVPASRTRVFAGARWLAERERVRVSRLLDGSSSADYDDPRALRYLAVRSFVGGLGAGIFLLIAWGAASGVVMASQLVAGQPIGDVTGDWYDPIVVGLLGVLLVFLAIQGLIGVAATERSLANHFLGPSDRELLRRRVTQLTTSRAEVLEAVTEERRRIERDLHDGVQQRLVALGMLLGRARRAEDPARAGELVRQAHDESQRALDELREVTWRVYPIALDDGGLDIALEALAERASVPVAVDYAVPARPDPATETVAYFVVAEAVTNAAKHASATSVRIEVCEDSGVSEVPGMLTVRVTDDGVGGAVATGGGLSGLARRVAAADGEFTVDSPGGGPTVVTARLPCG